MDMLDKIHKASEKFLIPETVDEMCKVIVEEAIRLLDADSGSIFLEKNNTLTRVYTSEEMLNNVIIRAKGIVYRTYKTNTAKAFDIDTIGKIHPRLKKIGFKSVIFIPLSNKDKSIGVLTVQSRKKKHSVKNN